MNSSTPWCNLFSTASKFNINLYPSRYRQLLILSLWVFCASHLVLLVIDELPVLIAWYLGVGISLYLFLAIQCRVVVAKLASFIATNSPETSLILQANGLACFCESEPNELSQRSELNELGQVNQVSELQRQKLQLHNSSRQGWWGCRLNFVSAEQVIIDAQSVSQQTASPQSANQKIIHSVFIYKDSVCAQDYSRICRVVYALKTANANRQP